MKRNTPLTVSVALGIIKAGELEIGRYTVKPNTAGDARLETLEIRPFTYAEALSDDTIADIQEILIELLGVTLNKTALKDANNNPANGPEVKLAEVLSNAFKLLKPMSDDEKLALMLDFKTRIKAAKAAGNTELATELTSQFLELA